MHGHGTLFLYLAQRAQQKRLASSDATARTDAEARGRLGRRALFTIRGQAVLKQADPCW
jgi:hypothetical protein